MHMSLAKDASIRRQVNIINAKVFTGKKGGLKASWPVKLAKARDETPCGTQR